jgi:hypothetical protein
MDCDKVSYLKLLSPRQNGIGNPDAMEASTLVGSEWTAAPTNQYPVMILHLLSY